MADKNSAAQLYALCPQMVDLGVQSSAGPPHSRSFTYAIAVEGYEFEGTGRSKKAAKQDACAKALQSLPQIARGLDVTDSSRGVRRCPVNNPVRPLQEKLGTCFTWSDVQEVFGKSALMLLNELFGSAVQWGDVIPRGPQHARSFTAELTVKLGDRMYDFNGHCSRSKDAKQVAAFAALKGLANLDEELSSTDRRLDTRRGKSDHRKSERVEDLALQFDGLNLDLPVRDTSSADGVAAPVQSMLSRNPGRQVAGRRQGVTQAQDGNQGWNGAWKQLQSVEGTPYVENPKTTASPHTSASQPSTTSPLRVKPATIAEVSIKKYEEHAALLPTAASGRTMFAAVVLERGSSCHVVAIATGSMVMDGHRLCQDGSCVHDCHAPVVARRTFQRYLYQQIELALEESCRMSGRHVLSRKEQSVFSVDKQGTLHLCSDVKFHLFLSELPCGDARQGLLSDKRGCLHYKEEIGDATIPSLKEHEQTFVGVTSGRQRLRTMSCSDKILVWTALGMQGSLLSNLIDPVYVQSVVVGEGFDEDHVQQSLVHRLGSLPLPAPFGRSVVNIAGGSWKNSSKNGSQTATLCFNWAEGDSALELINCATGKRVDEAFSRLCKRSMLERMAALRNNSHLTKVLPDLEVSTTYRQAKNFCPAYRRAKKVVLSYLEVGGGYWVKKPDEVNSFHL